MSLREYDVKFVTKQSSVLFSAF